MMEQEPSQVVGLTVGCAQGGTDGSVGVALIEETMQEVANQDDRRTARPADWDPRLAELTTALKSRIPRAVQERCRAAKTRANCGLVAELCHAWASADEFLHIWDYRQENPKVLVMPADSPIITIAFCRPRPNVFDGEVHLLVVVCTRAKVGLVGLSVAQGGKTLVDPFGTGASSGGTVGASVVGSLQLHPLHGFEAPTHGALFHTVSHTADGHILLSCGAPYIYELAYSRTPRMFHSRCRLIRHTAGFWNSVPVLPQVLSIFPQATGRIRILQCASENYAVTVDDVGTLRLLTIEDKAVHRAESVATVVEVASLTINELANAYQALTGVRLAATLITHVFPSIGLDGHLRLRVVTASSERLLFVCTGASPSGPSSPSGGAARPARDGLSGKKAQRRYYGFWLQQATESRLGHGGNTSTASGGNGAWSPQRGGLAGLGDVIFGSAAAAAARARRSCSLDEVPEPCVYSNNVWVAAAHVPGQTVTEVGISARVKDSVGITGGTPGVVSLFRALNFNSVVFHIIEEMDSWCPRQGNILHDEAQEGEPSAFRATRTFAFFLEDSIQVVRLSLQAQAIGRAPATADECCLHFLQLALPPAAPAAAPLATAGAGDPNHAACTGVGIGSGWAWSFDDAGIPSFEQQDAFRRHHGGRPPPLELGRWSRGFLRFLAVVLRPVWNVMLVTAQLRGQEDTEVLVLTLSEHELTRLLAQLRPALRFARRALAASAESAAASPTQDPAAVVVSAGFGALPAAPPPARVAARSEMFTRNRVRAREGLAQVRRVVQETVDVVDRVQQIFGLLGVLQAHRCAYRVLQSPTLDATSLECLKTQPLSALVDASESLAPVVQLCTAMAVESGLTTPAAELVFDARSYPRPLPSSSAGNVAHPFGGFEHSASGARGVCHELEEQCPSIFARVDLAFVRARLGVTGGGTHGHTLDASSPDAAGEVLRRTAQCVCPSSNEDRWTALAQSVRAMALRDPRGATDICVEKLQQLQKATAAELGVAGAAACAGGASNGEVARSVSDRARSLLEALLGTVVLVDRSGGHGLIDQTLATRALVEHLLTKTTSLRLGSAELTGAVAVDTGGPRGSPAAEGVSAIHGAILDCLLSTPRLHPVLQALLDTTTMDVEAFLHSRSGSERIAAEMLWKHLLKHNRPTCASRVLLQLADRADPCSGLQERTNYLQLAREAVSRGLPQSQGLFESIGARLEIASRVQVPLYHDLRLIAADGRVAPWWREAANKRREELRQLLGLQELLSTVDDFCLFHIKLVIAGLSPASVQDGELISSVWRSVFFVPAVGPYAPAELVVEPAAPLHGLFPLLMLRRCDTFFAQSDQTPQLQEAATAKPGDLRIHSLRFLEELRSVTQAPTLWDIRNLVTLLEYSNCLWRRAMPSGDDGSHGGVEASDASGEPLADIRLRSRSATARSDATWVAYSVLMRPPFNYTLPSVVELYAALLEHLSKWLGELQARLPADPKRLRPRLRETDVFTHTGEVFVLVLGDMLNQVRECLIDERELEELRKWWPSVQCATAAIVARLADEAGEAASELVDTARRLESKGNMLYKRNVSAVALSSQAMPPPKLQPALEMAGASSSASASGSAKASLGKVTQSPFTLGDMLGGDSRQSTHSPRAADVPPSGRGRSPPRPPPLSPPFMGSVGGSGSGFCGPPRSKRGIGTEAVSSSSPQGSAVRSLETRQAPFGTDEGTVRRRGSDSSPVGEFGVMEGRAMRGRSSTEGSRRRNISESGLA
eukprot:TRINITY_DN16352_c0_g1_i1.p1 TRINITY_DN16352_c0_g1~~TRINITY_DN16352_c0_g1_i1.p1  ORF type:complete len:1765 (-),score=234.64 TRINITY_DN16352_c0_g1_i1:65-5299(-)